MNTIISFGLCPFVQRSLITMNYKKVPYEVNYIDLANKPDWFLKISPMGKVPILQVDDEVLFESAVINEYIDEVNGPSLHPADPLKKAKERAFIELASVALFNFYHTTSAIEKEGYETNRKLLEKNLEHLLNAFKGPYFRGNDFSLVDTSVIPLLQRIFLIEGLNSDLELNEIQRSKLNRWADATLQLEAVKKSVPDNFETDFHTFLKNKNSYIQMNSEGAM